MSETAPPYLADGDSSRERSDTDIGPLAAFVRTGLPRPLLVGYGDKRTVVIVPPPSVETALVLLSMLGDAAGGDEATRSVLYPMLSRWAGVKVAHLLMGQDDPEESARLLHRLLSEGVPEPKESGGGSPMARVRWDVVALELCKSFGWALSEVMAMPWPRFLLVVSRLDAIEARAALRGIPLAILAHTRESESVVEGLRERAGEIAESAPKDTRIAALEMQQAQALSRATMGPPRKRADALAEYHRITAELVALTGDD